MVFIGEQTNETKEVSLVMGEGEAADTRFLSTWLGEKEDKYIRIQRGMGAWSKVKKAETLKDLQAYSGQGQGRRRRRLKLHVVQL